MRVNIQGCFCRIFQRYYIHCPRICDGPKSTEEKKLVTVSVIAQHNERLQRFTRCNFKDGHSYNFLKKGFLIKCPVVALHEVIVKFYVQSHVLSTRTQKAPIQFHNWCQTKQGVEGFLGNKPMAYQYLLGRAVPYYLWTNDAVSIQLLIYNVIMGRIFCQILSFQGRPAVCKSSPSYTGSVLIDNSLTLFRKCL